MSIWPEWMDDSPLRFEFLERYYALLGSKSRVAMLTSSNYPRDFEKARQYEITASLTKPLSEEEVAGLVNKARR